MEILIIVVIVLVVLFILFRIFKAFIKWIIIILIAILAIAYFSNPKRDDHFKGVKDVAKDLDMKKIKDKLEVDDYKIFSLAKAKVRGEEKVVGIGAFGKVWYFDDIKEKFEK